MKNYVLYHERDHVERYWTGDFTRSGAPQVSTDTRKAYRSPTAKQGYLAGASCRCFMNWRVGVRR